MKRVIVALMLVFTMCLLVACGQDERIENAQETAIGAQAEARDAVEDYNEQVQELEEDAETVELELE